MPASAAVGTLGKAARRRSAATAIGRTVPAFGAAGGEPGVCGVNRIERRDGSRETLAHIGSAVMEPGDVFVIETPGGGGYGNAV